MSPSAVSPGSGQFTLHVTGANFAAGASVTWNGVELETVFISTRQLSATVPSAKVASSGTGSIQVVNPAPKGGASHTIYFPVAAPAPAVAFAQSNEILTGAFANGIVTADFNRDGQLDVATANDSDSVSVLLGNGGGSFQTAVNYQGSLQRGSLRDGNRGLQQ